MSGHPPFGAQIMLNGHEYVACQARKEGIQFTKEGNCFTQISDTTRLAQIADTLCSPDIIGRLNQEGGLDLLGLLVLCVGFIRAGEDPLPLRLLELSGRIQS